MLLCRSLQVHFSTPPVQKSYHEHDIENNLCTTLKQAGLYAIKDFLAQTIQYITFALVYKILKRRSVAARNLSACKILVHKTKI